MASLHHLACKLEEEEEDEEEEEEEEEGEAGFKMFITQQQGNE